MTILQFHANSEQTTSVLGDIRRCFIEKEFYIENNNNFKKLK